MRYILNKKLFKSILYEAGYKGVSDFSRKTAMHRNTVLEYLSGKSVFSSAFIKLSEALKSDPLGLIVASSDTTADLPHLHEIKFVIASILKVDKKIAVVLLGSRARNKEKDFSDWDIGITRGENPISGLEYLKIKQIVEEAADDLPREVDVINLDQAPKWFLEETDYEPVFLDGDEKAFQYIKGVMHGIRKKEAA